MPRLFKKRRTTKIQKFHTSVIQHKIIKLTYLQTLAIMGGIGSIKEVAGETEGGTETISGPFSSTGGSKKKRKIGQIVGGIFGGVGGAILGGSIGSALGKKTTVNQTTTVTDKGWRVVKTWLQPEFDRIRYAIGVRELTISQFRYERVSEVISQPWSSPKDITKVTLIVDQFIPPQFPPGQDYIQYFIKAEVSDAEWIRINPIGHRTIFTSAGQIVPRIVNFNTERPATSRLEDVYITTNSEVRSVRFRAVLSRPDTVEKTDIAADGYTPILKSYRMLLHPRGGL